MDPTTFNILCAAAGIGLMIGSYFGYRITRAFERMAESAERVAKASEQNFAGALTGVAEALEASGNAMTGLQQAAQNYLDYDRHRSG